jgi:hypothetical protein
VNAQRSPKTRLSRSPLSSGSIAGRQSWWVLSKPIGLVDCLQGGVQRTTVGTENALNAPSGTSRYVLDLSTGGGRQTVPNQSSVCFLTNVDTLQGQQVKVDPKARLARHFKERMTSPAKAPRASEHSCRS